MAIKKNSDGKSATITRAESDSVSGRSTPNRVNAIPTPKSAPTVKGPSRRAGARRQTKG